MHRFFLLTTLLTALATAEPVRDHRLVAELVPEMDAIVPGETLTVGLNIKHDPHWHTYWKNPGIAGMPTKLDWDLPKGFEAGPIQWARPQSVKMAVYNTNGYEGEVTLLVDIKTPKDLEPGTKISLKAKTAWMMCADACYPSSAKLSVTVPVAKEAKAHQRGRKLAAETRKTMPKENKVWDTKATIGESTATLILKTKKGRPAEAIVADEFYFFSEDGLIDSHPQQKITREPDGAYKMVLQLAEFRPKSPTSLNGVLLYKADAEAKAVLIRADFENEES